MRREQERECYILTLTPAPPGRDHLGRPPIYRLKAALKRLLRDQGLKCTRVEFHETGMSVDKENVIATEKGLT